MARVQIASLPWGYFVGGDGRPVPSAPGILKDSNGVTAKVYSTATGTTLLTAGQFITNAEGFLAGYVEEGTYTLTDPDGDDTTVEAVSGRTLSRFPVKSYGAIGNDPLTDDTAGIQAAVTAAEAAAASGNGAVVEFNPSTTYYLNKAGTRGILFSPDNAGTRGKVTVKGNGCTLKLSANTYQAFSFGKTAIYDHFRNVEVTDFVVDANQVSIYAHVLIGNYDPDSGIARVNDPTYHTYFEDITVRRCLVKNVKTLENSNPFRVGVAFWVKHGHADEATQTYIKNILCEDITVGDGITGGGQSGFMFLGQNDAAGTEGGSTNVYIDNIQLIRCRHDRLAGVAPTTLVGANSFHIGSYAHCGEIKLKDCYARGSGDECYEFNTIARLTVENCVAEDSWNECYLTHNFRDFPATDTVQRQQHNYVRCQARAIGITGGANCKGFRVGGNTGTNTHGTIHYEDCSYYNKTTVGIISPAFSAGGGTGVRTAFEEIILEDCAAVYPSISGSWAAAFPYAVSVRASNNGARFSTRGFRFKAAGTISSAPVNYIPFWFETADLSTYLVLDLDRITIDSSITGLGSDTTRAIGLAPGLSSQVTALRGSRISRMFIKALAGDSTPRAISIRGTAILGIANMLRIENCDFSNMTAGNGVAFDSAQNKDKVFQRGNVAYPTWPIAPSAVTDPGSATAYQNLDAYPETIAISGGTVSQIALSTDGSAFTNTGLTSGNFYLDPGSAIKVTHTGAPTWTKVPLK